MLQSEFKPRKLGNNESLITNHPDDFIILPDGEITIQSGGVFFNYIDEFEKLTDHEQSCICNFVLEMNEKHGGSNKYLKEFQKKNGKFYAINWLEESDLKG